jgi:Tfp pilus assembly protein PilX
MFSMGALRRSLHPRDEDGIALVLALIVLVFFSITTVAAVTMSDSSQTTAATSSYQQNATELAEAGINDAEAALNATGTNPSSPTLFGCAAGASGASNCASYTAVTFCIQAASCVSGASGTASVYGYFSGTNAGTFNGTAVAASTWLLLSTGYAADPGGAGMARRALKGLVTVHAITGGSIAAVWNHLFLTAPLVANTCQTSINGSSLILNAPIYAIGNLCISASGAAIKESGSPVDLQVGGKLVLSGSNTSVGADATHPITSGVVVGGCNTTSVSSATTACNSGSYKYWVASTDTFSNVLAPVETTADQQSDYNGFDPGPMHTCLTGTTPAPLNNNQFDFTSGAGEPNDSGSGSSGGTMDLTPSASYACISKNGTGTGYLIWNNNTSGAITVSGITVQPKTLAINGSIFFDSNVTASQSFTYAGTAAIEFSGTFNMSNSTTTICAASPCNYAVNAWQGTSGNLSMLTLVSLISGSSSAFSFNATTIGVQCSLWTQPTSTASFSGTNVTLEGPLALGSFSVGASSFTLEPLPVIKNMPTGAPLPPNMAVSISAPSYTS